MRYLFLYLINTHTGKDHTNHQNSALKPQPSINTFSYTNVSLAIKTLLCPIIINNWF